MKHSILSWSRKLHNWVGVYISIVTLVWLIEMIVLPSMYKVELRTDAQVVEDIVQEDNVIPIQDNILSINDVLNLAKQEKAAGKPITVDELVFYPEKNIWLVRDKEKYIDISFNSISGEVITREFNTSKLIEEKMALSWVFPSLGYAIKMSYQPAFVFLCLTGIYIFFSRKGSSKKKIARQNGNTLDLMKKCEVCLCESIKDPKLAGRFAALGFMPGVPIKVLNNNGRGPLLVLVRHTRVALSRKIASTLLVIKESK